MKSKTFMTALTKINDDRVDIHFKAGGPLTHLINVALTHIDGDLYRSTDTMGKEWYFSVEDVLMVGSLRSS